MDELALLRESKPATAAMSPSSRRMARQRLSAAMARERRRSRVRPGLVGVTVAALAGVLLHVTYLATSSSGLPDERPAAPGFAPSEAGDALRAIAEDARPAQVVVPPDDEYVYVREKLVTTPIHGDGRERTYIDETWRSVDQTRPTRSSEFGRSWDTPPSDQTYPFPRDVLRGFAGKPDELLAAAAETTRGGPLTREEERTAFFVLKGLLDPRHAAPADVRVTAIEALAQLPHIRVVHGLEDARGRAGIGITLDSRVKVDTVLIDPMTLEFLGRQDEVQLEPSRRPLHVVSTILEVAGVRELGERP